MTTAKIIAVIGLIAMISVLFYGFVFGDFAQDGSKILANPWGIVSIVDLYVGFALFSGWIIFRERSIWKATIWVLLMMMLGFFTGALYVLIALQTSAGDWKRFWMGKMSDSNA